MPDGWRKVVRETGLIEWECPHGVGHPAPYGAQENRYVAETWHLPNFCWGSHGCDGCCSVYHT